MSRVGPGIDAAPPPDGCLDAVWTDAGLSLATKCLRDRNTGEMYKFEVPDLTVAEQVIGLDGTPNLELWNLLAPEQGFQHEQVIQREDFLTYLESAMNMRVIQMGNGEHHYAAGRIYETDSNRFAAVEAREENPFALVSTRQALEKYDYNGLLQKFVKPVDTTESEQSHADDDSKLFRGYWALNYGNMKSSNDLEKQALGVVAGTPYPGHGLVKRWAGLCGEPAEIVSDDDNKGTEFEGFADKIYEHFVGAQVIQAILRFGRHESVYENEGATVYVITNTLPDWFDVSEQLHVHGEMDENVGVVLATLGEIAAITDRPGLAAVTVPTLHEHIAADSRLPNISKRTVASIVDKIRDLNAVTVREDAGKNKADLIRLTGDVELVRRDSEVVVLTGSHAYVCESLADWEPRFQQVTNV
jgi:hypothetical protein